MCPSIAAVVKSDVDTMRFRVFLLAPLLVVALIGCSDRSVTARMEAHPWKLGVADVAFMKGRMIRGGVVIGRYRLIEGNVIEFNWMGKRQPLVVRVECGEKDAPMRWYRVEPGGGLLLEFYPHG